MSLRKQATILGIAPSYLSMLVNGKRKWPDALRHRYEELVNTPNQSVNKQGSSGLLPAKLSENMVGRQGFEPWTPGLKGRIPRYLTVRHRPPVSAIPGSPLTASASVLCCAPPLVSKVVSTRRS